MINIKDILLKLHYLNLEVNKIYQILLTLYKYKDINDAILMKVLMHDYKAFKQLSIIEIKEQLFLKQIGYTTLVCSDYPKVLNNIFMPPLVLFFKGNYQLIDTKSIAVIGTRTYSQYGIKACDYFVGELVKHNLTIISGLAKGIDTFSHQKAIEYGGRTIGVLGSGFLNIYPKENQKLADEIASNHLLLSEYNPFEPPKKSHFPFRNRIVSGLSNGVLVIEAKEKSGTLITCDYALDQNKDVYVVPGDIFRENSHGTNNLIKQGAKLVSTINDIMDFFVK